MKTSDIPEFICTACFEAMDCASDMLGDRTPEPGDVTLCIRCGTAYVFDENLNLVDPSPEQLEVINSDPRIVLLRLGLSKIKRPSNN